MHVGRRTSLVAVAAGAVTVIPFLVGAGSGRTSHLSTPSCGTTITASVTLSGDMSCSGSNGIIVGANSVTVNLNGHTISGNGTGLGVGDTSHTGVVVENGIIDDFSSAVSIAGNGNNSRVTGIRAENSGTGIDISSSDHVVVSGNTAVANSVGIVLLAGTGDQLTANLVTDSATHGIEVESIPSAVVTGNKSLSNTDNGFHVIGPTTGTMSGNIANGNGGYGLFVNPNEPAFKTGLTVSKNHAAFNGNLGIAATVPGVVDGGGNVVQDNGAAAQCKDLVCVSP